MLAEICIVCYLLFDESVNDANDLLLTFKMVIDTIARWQYKWVQENEVNEDKIKGSIERDSLF